MPHDTPKPEPLPLWVWLLMGFVAALAVLKAWGAL